VGVITLQVVGKMNSAVLAATAIASLWTSLAVAQQRPVYDDFDTQMKGSDHVGPLGATFFDDHTDFNSGATTFLVTDVSLKGSSSLPVALQRSLQAYDDGTDRVLAQYPAWTNFEVPYLSGIYKSNPVQHSDTGWRSAYLHSSSLQRCSMTSGAPTVTKSSGKDHDWESFEYWRGNHLYMPGGAQEPLLIVPTSDPKNPTTGDTYYWATSSHWRFSCLSSTKNGAGGEGFVGLAPDGKKYFFDWLVRWRDARTLWTTEPSTGDQTVLQTAEYRLLVSRVEDRFGNWVNYTYSGKNLTGVTANDGRQLNITYDTSDRIASVADGFQTWNYSHANGVQVTFPDSTTWRATMSGPGITRANPSSCNSEAVRYTGEYTLNIEHRTGANASFNLKPMRRGFSYTTRTPASTCPQTPKYVDGIALYTKTITGPGLASKTWSITYGPANACYTYPVTECSAGWPTTRYVDVQGADGMFTRYTFGNKWRDNEGALLSTQTGSSISSILRTEQVGWQTFPAPGSASGGGYLATIVRLEATRTVTQDGATHSSTRSNWDDYFNPQTLVESGPNGGSRTTQSTYNNNKTKWVIGQLATSTAPATTLSRVIDANANVTSETVDGVATSYTYHSDGNVATITYPRSLTHSFSNYKRGIPQLETQPEDITITRVVNDRGFVISETDGEQHAKAYTYDATGRVASIDLPRGNDSVGTYTSLSKTVTRGSLVETTIYDGLYRITRVTLGGIATDYEYDAYDQKTFESNPGAAIGTRFEYDALGRLTKLTNADTTTKIFTYGAGTASERDERLNTTTFTYRSFGDPDEKLLMSITAPHVAANVSISRASNQLVSSVTQAGIARSYGYDSHNYLTSETQPELATISYGRDDAGNMTSRTVGANQATFVYDGQNRLTTATYSDGSPTISRTYSKTGRLRNLSSSVSVRALDYDSNDNLTTETVTVGSVSLNAQYSYNGNDQLSTITYPISGRVVSYSPDVLGRPTQVSGYINGILYWPSGLPQQLTYANGIVTTYDQNSRLWPSGFSTRRNNTYYISSAYGFDGAGNLNSVADSVDPSMNRGFGYDALNRLTTANGPWGNGTLTYDGAGNVKTQSLGTFGLSYTYGGQNRLDSVTGSRSTTYSYDVYGNMTFGNGATYNYDGVPNMICANCATASRVDYRYDGLGNRVTVKKGTITTYEFTSSKGDLLVEYTPSVDNKLIEYIHLAGKRIAQRVSDSKPSTPVTPARTVISPGSSGSITLGVNVGGASPGGSVTFSENGTVLGTAFVMNGRAVIEIQGLAQGSHTITATYSGDANNSSNTVVFNIKIMNLNWLPVVLDLILSN
jgi:YD repeat-containing protein